MTVPLVPRHKRLDLSLWVIAAISVATAISLCLGAVFILPRILKGADNTDAVVRGSELQSCRSEYASRVTEATSDVTVLTLRGLAAVALADDAALHRLVTPDSSGLSPATRAQDAVQDATVRYRRALVLSRIDPSAFLIECRKLTKPGG